MARARRTRTRSSAARFIGFGELAAIGRYSHYEHASVSFDEAHARRWPWYRRDNMAPFARRDAVLDLLATQRRGVHIAEIASRLGVEQPYTALSRLLDDLAFDGSVVALPGQRFKLSRDQVEQRGATFEGILNVNPRGF